MPKALNQTFSNFIIVAVIFALGVFIYPYAEFFGIGIHVYAIGDKTETLADAIDPARGSLPPAGKHADSKGPLPSAVMIDAPFSSQAPLEDWGQPWQDACEEASALMAVAWARGFALTPAFAAEEILKQVDFEEQTLGYHRDTNIADTARLIADFYRYPYIEMRHSGVTPESIKQELASGNLVIVPLAGELLENPYFTRPPHYHMVVIRGYDDWSGEFITNEPGTKNGEAFRYRYENLFEAIHDWTGSADAILEGAKAMIVVKPVMPPRK